MTLPSWSSLSCGSTSDQQINKAYEHITGQGEGYARETYQTRPSSVPHVAITLGENLSDIKERTMQRFRNVTYKDSEGLKAEMNLVS